MCAQFDLKLMKPDYRIPDDMAAEVLAESTRLYAESNNGYSFADLQQACADIQIPPHIVKQAISNVEEKRSGEQLKHQQFRDRLKTQVNKGISSGIALLVPAIAIASIFIFRHQLKPAVSKVISHLNFQQPKATSQFTILMVEKGQLKYLTNPQGLSISVSNVTYNRDKINIGTDGYSDLEICLYSDEIDTRLPDPVSCPSGKLGGSYKYQGIYNYRIKIIEIRSESIVFQIEQLSNEPKSALSQSQEEVEQLHKEREKSQIQIKELQDRIESTLSQSQKEVKQLQEEREKSQIQIKELQDRIESTLSHNQKEVRQLQEEREKSQLQLEEFQDRIQSTLNQSQKEVKQLREERGKSQLQLEKSQIQIGELQDRIERFRERVNQLEGPL
jgi:DNA repair exonuclease SbcCD ATPase subunit